MRILAAGNHNNALLLAMASLGKRQTSLFGGKSTVGGSFLHVFMCVAAGIRVTVGACGCWKWVAVWQMEMERERCDNVHIC